MMTRQDSLGETLAESLGDRVTIVLLTYNCGHRLRGVIERLLDVGVPVLAVDNASSDDTREVLAEYPQIDTVVLPHNIGAAARNVGLERARTPYVAFCDDDGWYEPAGLRIAADLLDRYDRLAVVNARILVGAQEELDPISAEMAQSPLADDQGIPGAVLLGFMAGAVIVRATAYREAGGYEPKFFIGGEEETLSFKLARLGWQMRYVPSVVVHHEPSVANAPRLRAFGMRNTLWNCWLHRRLPNALKYTAFVLADSPKNADWVKGMAQALGGAVWVVRRRDPMPAHLDQALATLDRRRYRHRRSVWNRVDPLKQQSRPDRSGRPLGAARAGQRAARVDAAGRICAEPGRADAGRSASRDG